MKIQFIGQGDPENPEENSLANVLIKSFKENDFHTFTCITAFVSPSGINGIAKLIEDATHLENITIVTGIDQKGTSKEALEALLNLNINAYVFYFPSPTPIFHPKIYLFEGGVNSKLIIGSSNLTSGGLFRNFEASLLVNLETIHKEDRQIINDLKDNFSSIFDHTDPNLKKLTSKLIEYLVEMGIVPTEEERKSAYNKKISELKETGKTIFDIFPKRAIPTNPKNWLPIETELVPIEPEQKSNEDNGDKAKGNENEESMLTSPILPVTAAPEVGFYDLKTGDIVVSKTAKVPGIIAVTGNDKHGYFVGWVSEVQQFRIHDVKSEFRRLYPGNGKLPIKYEYPEYENLRLLALKWIAMGMPGNMGQKKK